eukprot:Em0011g875a
MAATESRLADRLSVPVAADDSQSRFICRSCKNKFMAAESFRTTAKETYQNNNGSLEFILSGTGRKRAKNTSSPGASPHTNQCRPVAKRSGRRLTYLDSHDFTEAIVLDPCENITEDAMAATSSVKGAEVITAVCPEFEKIVKTLAGGNVKFICRALLANPDLREEAVSKVSRTICEECSLLCKKNAQPVSLFHHMSLAQAESFSWTQVIMELSTKAPTLFKIIHNSVVTQGLVRNKHKRAFYSCYLAQLVKVYKEVPVVQEANDAEDTDALSHSQQVVTAILSAAEEEKEKKYSEAAALLQASFTPLVVPVDRVLG